MLILHGIKTSHFNADRYIPQYLTLKKLVITQTDRTRLVMPAKAGIHGFSIIVAPRPRLCGDMPALGATFLYFRLVRRRRRGTLV
jgi:hypothetical protein